MLFVPVANLFALRALLFKESSSSSDDAETSEPLIKSLASFFGAALGIPLLIFVAAMGALEYSNLSPPRVVTDQSNAFAPPDRKFMLADGVFFGTYNGKDLYLLSETLSGDKENFELTAGYINQSTTQKGYITFYFVHSSTGWLYYDSMDEIGKIPVSQLSDEGIVKRIWNYCMSGQTLKAPTQNKSSNKSVYHYPEQRENGRLVWAGYKYGLGCYLDTQSVHVRDDTNQFKDWVQVVKLYDEDRLFESLTQNFHWDPQNGACLGGRGISPIRDQNSMLQFETGWQYAFGQKFK